jgi:hypothetical protein
MGFGAVFLLAFAGGMAGLYSLRPGLITPEGVVERMRRLKIGVVAMAAAAWGTVITGTWIVYPWYRAGDETSSPLSPKFQLLANKATANWHEFGMEWKEHIAWIAPIPIQPGRRRQPRAGQQDRAGAAPPPLTSEHVLG